MADPRDLEVAFPYYGDSLDKFARAYQIPLTSEMTARGSPLDDEFLAFQAEFAEELRKRAGMTDAQVDAEYGNNLRPRGTLNWEWVQAILRAIDKNSPGMNQATLEVFTRDVFLYTTRAGVRDEIDRIERRRSPKNRRSSWRTRSGLSWHTACFVLIGAS